ncbi:hypothetical protein [Phycicoccus sp.]|uniref:hypothetical protein n=1 Tax=Phycicoccus sp. TaxID=1902410 RepID=UPI002BF09EF5|nr:hypothetical protein [Phycicoccus sp.]HMM95353.1 hypothetical protein [Phycicoccus sp.]
MDDDSLHRNSFTMRISREDALSYGFEQPTPEEVTTARARLVGFHAEQVAAHEETKVFLSRVAVHSTGDDLTARLLRLHHHGEGDWDRRDCVACGNGDHPIAWPCETAGLVLDELGVVIPADVVIDEPRPIGEPDPDNPYWPYPKSRQAFLDAFFPMSFVTLSEPITYPTREESP